MFFNKRLIAEETGQRSSAISLTTRIGNFALRRSRSETDAMRAAFETLLEPCWDPLWRYAYNFTNNVEDARDLLSETALEGFKFPGMKNYCRELFRCQETPIGMKAVSERKE